ncbi:MAG TPA: YoaK family protein [Sphingomonas sp.]|nr:YoaK family protein [Sphingomonas sp.]
MTNYDTRFWVLAAGLSGMAGYVDAIGFLKLGGMFVSFMSGNSTQLAVGAVIDPAMASMAARLLAGFVAGVVAGTWLAAMSGGRRKPIVLTFVGMILAVAAGTDGRFSDQVTTIMMAASMGAANTVFQRAGEVSIGVTYMTGTLVKFGQRLAGAVIGGPRWAWLPYLMLWVALVGGAAAGALAYSRLGTNGMWIAVAVAMVLAAYAAALGPAERVVVRTGR